MFFNKSDFCVNAKNITNINFSDKDAKIIGMMYYVLSDEVKREIMNNGSIRKSFHRTGITRDNNGLLHDSVPELTDIRTDWVKDEIFSCPESAKDTMSKGHFIWKYKEYLRHLTINSLEDFRILYERSCEFVKEYCMYKGSIGHDVSYHTELVTRNIIHNILVPCMDICQIMYKSPLTDNLYIFYSSIFEFFNQLVYFVNHNKNDEVYIKSFVFTLCNFYHLLGINKGYLRNELKGADPFVLLYIHSNNIDLITLRDKAGYISYNILRYGEKPSETTMPDIQPITESYEDIYINNGEISGMAESDITIFGDDNMIKSIARNSDNLKMDLRHFNSNMIRSYMNKDDNVRVDFVIDDQYKMYLQAELQCKMLVVNIRNANETNMVTILNYENDNFVLFTLSDDQDTLYGLTINENPDNNERKLISIDRDEDMTFNFVINDNEE